MNSVCSSSSHTTWKQAGWNPQLQSRPRNFWKKSPHLQESYFFIYGEFRCLILDLLIPNTMKEMSCFCMTFSSLLEQMVKAYKYMTGIFSVTHTSEQQASDCDKQPTEMDVSFLEEQYDHIKQKQKLQSHVIVFKTGMLIFIGKKMPM